MAHDRLRLTLPPSVNHAYLVRSGRRVKRAEVVAWQEAASWEAVEWRRKTGWLLPPPDQWIFLDMWVWFPDYRTRDPSNLLKVLLDAFTGILWHDDNQVLPRQQGYWVRPGYGAVELTLQAQSPDPDPLGTVRTPRITAPGLPIGRRRTSSSSVRMC